jgi:hypothetical protein
VFMFGASDHGYVTAGIADGLGQLLARDKLVEAGYRLTFEQTAKTFESPELLLQSSSAGKQQP